MEKRPDVKNLFIVLPPFLVEVFARAGITNGITMRRYANILLSQGLNSLDRLLEAPPSDLSSLGIKLAEANDIWKAGMAMASANSETFTVQNETQQALDLTKPTLMISYQWDSQSTAIQIRDYLLGTGKFNVIMDIEGIKGNFLTWMEQSVRASHAIILVITPKYQSSKNCEKEACRANALNKKLVPIMLDPDYKGDAWLAMLIAGLMFYDGSTPGALQESLRTIVDRELPHAL
jgi:hypothetical protein